MTTSILTPAILIFTVAVLIVYIAKLLAGGEVLFASRQILIMAPGFYAFANLAVDHNTNFGSHMNLSGNNLTDSMVK